MRLHGSPSDWAGLLALVLMWGTAFVFIRVAVTTLPPVSLATARIVTAAAVLCVAVAVARLRFPPLGRIWLQFLVLGIVGNALPFFLISWGQERVPSGLTGILMAVIPLATLVLAHFLVAEEPMTRRRTLGFVLGFLGILLLLGREAVLELGGRDSELAREAAVLGGALCYAVNSILVRRLPPHHALVASASVLLMASLVMVPAALAFDPVRSLAPEPASLAAALWLGLVPTAAATLVYFRVVASAGPTFLSLVNYLIPVVAVAAGMAAFAERPGWTAVAALVLILSGIALSQIPPARSSPEP